MRGASLLRTIPNLLRRTIHRVWLTLAGEALLEFVGAAGCLDCAITADLVDSGRIHLFEWWESQADEAAAVVNLCR